MAGTFGTTLSTTVYPKNNYAGTAAPTKSNDDTVLGGEYSVGSLWFDTTASPRQAYECLDASTGAAVWSEIGPGLLATTAATATTTSTGLVAVPTMTITPGVEGVYEAVLQLDYVKIATTGQQAIFSFDLNGVTQEQFQVKAGTTNAIKPAQHRGRVTVTNVLHAVAYRYRSTNVGSQVELRHRNMWLRRVG